MKLGQMMQTDNSQREHKSAKWSRMRSLARMIASHPRETAWDCFRVGRIIDELRSLCTRGRWYDWLERCGIHPRLASHCATTFRRATQHNLGKDELSRFGASACRVLLHPKCKGKERQRLLELRKKGLISYHDCLSVVGWATGQVPQLECSAMPTALDNDPKWADTGRRLEDLLRREGVSSVWIHNFQDEAEEGEPGEKSVLITTMGGVKVYSRRATLHDALRHAVGEEPVKACTKCGQLKQPHELTLRGCVCKQCERIRGRESRKKAKSEKSGESA